MSRPRPLLKLTQVELLALYPTIKADFPRLTEFVYELQFRSTMDKPFKAQALEQLLKLQAKINQPEPAKLPQPSTTLPPPAPDFLFPSTNIASTRKKLMGSRFAGKSWYEVGLLKVSGYSVGITEGKSTKERRSILNWIFLQDELHDIDDPAYASEWGEPKSTTRLQKMANSLASFARNAQRSPHDTSVAVKEWKEDLDYLYHTFYQQWHRVPWPDIET